MKIGDYKKKQLLQNIKIKQQLSVDDYASTSPICSHSTGSFLESELISA